MRFSIHFDSKHQFQTFLPITAPNPYITPELFNSLNTITTQIILIRIPIGPLLIFEDGLNPNIGSALFAKFSSISPMGFILMAQLYTLLFYTTWYQFL